MTILASRTHKVVGAGGPHVVDAILCVILNLYSVSAAQSAQGTAQHTSVWSVAFVPLLSTGEGSTCVGYGLGGGSR